MKILLAVDGSPYTDKMLAYLAAHKQLFDASHEYTLFTVPPILPPRVRSALGKEAVDAYYAEEAEKVLAPALKLLQDNGLSCKTSSKIGHAGETIAKQAETGNYDLLVMGSHGHNALEKLVMGSVSTQVLANCGVPVLLVR
ncbi:MAG TPA: universal stress protein [Burkholderiaceae bacterium]|nr:universal stress protein [Burkholderiaceae bacterium]